MEAAGPKPVPETPAQPNATKDTCFSLLGERWQKTSTKPQAKPCPAVRNDQTSEQNDQNGRWSGSEPSLAERIQEGSRDPGH